MTQNLTYAVADLHGAFDVLNHAWAAIEGHSGARPGGRRTTVFLGDYIDRGPQSRDIIERLLAGPPGGWEWICLKGNHEDIMSRVWHRRDPVGWWLENGGGATLTSYGQKGGDIADPTVVPAGHIQWVDQRPLMHIDLHRVFVHAAVDPTVQLHEQDIETLLWHRHPDGFAEGHGDLHVVHGHDAFEDGPLLLRGRTALDTYAYQTGRLVVAVFDDDRPGGPIDLIEVKRGRTRRL